MVIVSRIKLQGIYFDSHFSQTEQDCIPIDGGTQCHRFCAVRDRVKPSIFEVPSNFLAQQCFQNPGAES